MTMPFGRYRGWAVRDLPDWYLEWLSEKPALFGKLREAVDEEYYLRFGGQQKQRPTASPTSATLHLAPEFVPGFREIVELGYKTAAKKHHPDLGGDPDTMRRLNDLIQSVRVQLAQIEGALG